MVATVFPIVSKPFHLLIFSIRIQASGFQANLLQVTGRGAVAINPINENNPCETGCCKATGNRFRADSRRENEEFALQ